jgi:uncharacterized protein
MMGSSSKESDAGARPDGGREERPEGAAGRAEAPPPEAETLEELSLEQVEAGLDSLRGAGRLDEARVRRMRARSALPGELFRAGEGPLRQVAPGGIAAGAQVNMVEQGVLRAERYGYLSLVDNRLSVVSPLWVEPRRMAVYWLLLDPEARPLTPEMILRCLDDRQVIEGIWREAIESAVAPVAAGKHRCGAVLIATGRLPKHGQDALVQVLVETLSGQRPGTEAISVVQEKQVIARRLLPTPGVPGVDVCGAGVAARDGKDQRLRAGDNVLVERLGNVEIFRAGVRGLAFLEGEQLSVAKVLTVNGSVGFETGDLDFDGLVRIEGSVTRGFSVKASGSIAVGGTVESGGLVQARGDINVDGGIVGGKTRVVSGGTVCARFVEEATVMATGDIQLGNYASRALLVAGGWVRIARSDASHGGSIVGGEAWARSGVDVYLAGSPGGVPTVLAAGLVPSLAGKLDKVKDGLDTSYSQLLRHLERFGLTRVDPTQIHNLISAATGPRRRLLLNTAERLTKIVKIYQSLLKAQKQLKQQIQGHAQGAQIVIRERVFAGLVIRIGEQKLDAQNNAGPLRFLLAEGKLVEQAEDSAA